jgi:hypothetical protein
MELAEIVLAIIFSGLLIVIIISVFFFYKNKLQQIKTIKKSVAEVRLEKLKLKEPLPDYKSIEEKTSGRYTPVKLKEDKHNGRDNVLHSHTEPVLGNNNRNMLFASRIKNASKRFSRLERVI